MKHLKNICLAILTATFMWIAQPSQAQQMEAGFQLLESGHFAEAESFFRKTLTSFPANKTARLCYGRAVGLAGNADKAISIFQELQTSDPANIEVALNLAEAWLWKAEPQQAIPIYLEILKSDSTLFGAQLGLANSYSMAQHYEAAFATIQTALAIQPENKQAQLSAKYIRLGYANKLSAQEQQYEQAIELAKENLTSYPNDEETLALMANIYLSAKDFEAAAMTYNQLTNEFAALKGESTALHLAEQDEEALALAKKLVTLSTGKEQEQLPAQLHYITALLWNNQLQLARFTIDSLSRVYSNQEEVLATEAEVAMYEGNFVLGSAKYAEFLKLDSASFAGNLGRASAKHALGSDLASYRIALRAQALFPGQQDISNFITELHHTHAPAISQSISVGKASDGSQVVAHRTQAKTSITPTFGMYLGRTAKSFYTQQEVGTISKSNSYQLGGHYQLSDRVKIKGAVTTTTVETNNQQVSHRTSDLGMDLWVTKNQKIGIGYQSELQDFNAKLLGQNLKTSHVVLKNIMYWKTKNLGWYTELYRSYFSDNNRRNLLFTSLYKNLQTKQPIKMGVNAMAMTFKTQQPEAYYSPDQFYKGEGFIGLQLQDPLLGIAFALDAAAGYQLVQNALQPNWRMQITAQKNIGRWQLETTYNYSTIAETQAAGFSFSQFTAKASLRLSDTPIFWKKLAK